MKVCLFGDARSVHLQRLAPGLAERGVTVHVVTARYAEVPGASVEVFRTPPFGLRNPHGWRGRFRRYLRDFFRRFDVVNVHFLHDWGFSPEDFQRGCLVATPWGSDIVPPPGETPPQRELIDTRISMLRSASAVTAWGPTFAGMVGRFADIDPDRIELLPLGADLKLFQPRPSSSVGAEPSCVGFFKGFREVYGATCLIRAIPIVLKALPNTRFELVGDGPELRKCQELGMRSGVAPALSWLDRRPHHAIPDLIARWDLTVIPSICESFGAAAVESSAMGVPVVASDVGGLPDTVRHDETGLLVPPADPFALAEAIITLLRDPERCRRMGRSGREMVEREFDWSSILDRWVRTYEKALDRSTVMS